MKTYKDTKIFMYSHVIATDANVEIASIDFFASEITSQQSYNKRELNRKSIKNGTQHITKGQYLVKDYTFTTKIKIDPERPYEHDHILEKLQSENQEVFCPDMKNVPFMADITINKTREPASPDRIPLEIQVVEVPELTVSEILGESIEWPVLRG